jgi:hypothetical protein
MTVARIGVAVAFIALAPVPATAQTHPALLSLIPLIEVYGPSGAPAPGFDVAGLRCAGLFYAQQAWRRDHGGAGPSRAELAASEVHLTRTQVYREAAGLSPVEAVRTTEADALRVIDLYRERFAANAANGPAWRDDPLIRGDTAYCTALAR